MIWDHHTNFRDGKVQNMNIMNEAPTSKWFQYTGYT